MEEPNNKELVLQRMAAVDKALDEYEAKIGLPSYQESRSADEVHEYMEMDREEMEKLQPESCNEIAGILSSYSWHLQRAKNREMARIKWADSVLRELATPRMSQHRNCGGSFSHIFDLACLGDDYTRKVLKIKDWCQLRLERLDFLANGINNKANMFIELGRSKRKFHNG